MSDAPVIAVLGGLGLIIGSFLNVVIYRLPRGESVVWPGSRCTTCGRTLRWFENVPVLAWLLLGGRCRSCRTPISWQYPAVEAVTGALFVWGYFAFGITPLLAVRLVFACVMVALFVIDLEHQILPNPITLGGLVFGLACSVVVEPGWRSALIAVAAGGLFPFLVAEVYFRVRGREGMGMGDFKMLAMVGAFLGWPLVWLTLILSCVLGIVIGGGILVASRRGMSTRLPFGTFIAVAAVLCAYLEVPALSFYERAIRAYLSWAGLA
jgi:leader peptidase (prepilin peptidase)/N-methyltransferase